MLAELIRLQSKLIGHSVHLNLVYAIFRDFINDLVHLDEQLSANGQLVYNFGLHSYIVALMLAEERTG